MLHRSKMLVNSFVFTRAFSEFSATALFMIISCMGGATNDQDGAGSLISSMIYGLATVVVMHIFGFISGAHANPCVTIACCLLGHIGSSMMFTYIFCQLAGAAFGYFLLLQMLSQGLTIGVCIVEPLDSLSNVQIVAIEAFLTSVLILAWSALWDVRSGRFLDSVTLRMGCLVTLCNLAGGKLTGASMNPAKVLIPQLFNGDPESILLQLGGQMLAAFVVPQIWHYAYTPCYRPLLIENAEIRNRYLQP
ncbi:PREDICTED: aquaporin-2 [Drosophila arizonae]|uniref:Aquaporin-2 n=1 Tax=Drosophila arizonae TaxID=7263 RepID=A0ABM1PLA3_DROAR|nr:PREDICTED: aquaporin-2 [Drosophila arizonae]